MVVKKVNRRSFSLKNKGKKITYGYKMAKILTVYSKSYYIIEILCLRDTFWFRLHTDPQFLKPPVQEFHKSGAATENVLLPSRLRLCLVLSNSVLKVRPWKRRALERQWRTKAETVLGRRQQPEKKKINSSALWHQYCIGR